MIATLAFVDVCVVDISSVPQFLEPGAGILHVHLHEVPVLGHLVNILQCPEPAALERREDDDLRDAQPLRVGIRIEFVQSEVAQGLVPILVPFGELIGCISVECRRRCIVPTIRTVY